MSGVARLKAFVAGQRREQRGRLALAASAAVMVSVAAVGLLGLSGWFIAGAALAGLGGAAAAQAFNYLLPSALIRLLAILRTGARYIERISGHEAALKALARLRPQLFDGLSRQPPQAALALSGGEASARMIQDVDALQTLFVRLSTPWAAVGGAFMAIGLAALTSPWAAMVLAIAILAAVAGAVVIGRRVADPAGRAVQVAAGSVKDRFAALQAATPELRAYRLEAWAVSAVDDVGRELDRRTASATVSGGWLAAWQTMVMGVAVVAVVAVSADSSLPMIALAALAAVTGVEAAGALVPALRQSGAAREAIQRIGPMLESPAAESGLDPKKSGLILLGVAAAEGDRIGIIGPSGAGKTTLIERLMALRAPIAGEMSIGGADVSRIAPSSVRGRFAYAAQEVRLLAGTVRENLQLARPGSSDDRLWEVLAGAVLDERVRAMPEGLDTLLGENGDRLSGGERRRLGLARAYLRDAPWLVLDEPTEGLDAVTEAEVLARLEVRLKATGQGLVLVSHRPAPTALCGMTVRVTCIGSDGGVIAADRSATAAR